MAVRRLAPPALQPEHFAFTPENLDWAKARIAKYPEGRQASAVIPLLWKAQEQSGGWLPQRAIEHVADMLGMDRIRALEVATFYTQFLLAPVGRKAHVQVCGTTPCMLRGSDDLFAVCRSRIHHDPLHVSEDGDFSWEEVECLGACVNAPMVLVGSDTYEDLTPESFEKMLDGFASGAPVRPGPQADRQFSAPEGGPTTLTDPALYARTEPNVGEALTDPDPKKPALAADEREQPAPTETIAAVAEQEDLPPPATQTDAIAAEEQEIAELLAALSKDATPEQKADAVGHRPEALSAPRGGKTDDLQRIRGIGPANEKKMHALGIYHFGQIAAWNREEVRWVGTYLSFPGRIDREDWIGQARLLAQGHDTEYSERADRGEAGKPDAKA